MVKKILLWLFVINLGIAFGAGLYESRIVIPDWLVQRPDGTSEWDAATAREANTGMRFWVFISTVPLTLLAFANLLAGWLAGGTIRKWWVSAALVALGDRVFTFSYFIPTMIRLMQDGSVSNADAVATFSQWTALNHVRHLIVLVAWLLALRTLSLLGTVPNQQLRMPGDTRDGR
jgi:glucan phosphoethanolaminetransferase (alkaline phosphatase superfamily)